MVDSSRSSEIFLVPPNIGGTAAAAAGPDFRVAFVPRQGLSVLVLPAGIAVAAAIVVILGDIVGVVVAAAAPRGVGGVGDNIIAGPSSGRRLETALPICGGMARIRSR